MLSEVGSFDPAWGNEAQLDGKYEVVLPSCAEEMEAGPSSVFSGTTGGGGILIRLSGSLSNVWASELQLLAPEGSPSGKGCLVRHEKILLWPLMEEFIPPGLSPAALASYKDALIKVMEDAFDKRVRLFLSMCHRWANLGHATVRIISASPVSNFAVEVTGRVMHVEAVRSELKSFLRWASYSKVVTPEVSGAVPCRSTGSSHHCLFSTGSCLGFRIRMC